MANKRSFNVQAQLRVDAPHLSMIESAVRSDFDDLLNGLITGPAESYVLRAFELVLTGAIGSSANSLQMIVDDGAILHGNSDQAGTFFIVNTGAANEVLNSTTNTKVDGGFTPSSSNYIGLEFTRETDSSTNATVYLWNPTTKDEFSKTLPLAKTLDYNIVISSTGFASNVLPIAIVQTDASNNVLSVTDRRPMLFRLGTAGDSAPDPTYQYPWNHHTEGRVENPFSSSTSSISPFRGGDKQILSMKEWMDAVMSMFIEIKGTPFWYSPNSGGSLIKLRTDVANMVASGTGYISHNSVTSGRINWSSDIYFNLVSSRLSYKINSNAATTDIVLADNQVAYINLVRGVSITPNLILINGSAVVASVGAVSWTADVLAGDFIKVASENDTKYYKILTVDSLTQVTLTEVYGGTSTGVVGIQCQYAWGTYQTDAAPSTNRHVYIADREDVALTEDVYWFLFRADNGGGTPKVYVRFTSTELEKGEDIQINDTTSLDLLNYVGSSGESDSDPDYTNATGAPIVNNYVVDADNLTLAIKKLDIILGTAISSSIQDNNLKMIDGGLWSWNLGATTLTWSSDAYIQVPGLTNVRNTIVAGSDANLTADGDVLYVTINRDSGVADNLAVSHGLISTVALTEDDFIIARRVGNDVIVGTNSIRLQDFQTEQLELNLLETRFKVVPNGTPDKTCYIYPSKRISDGKNIHTYIISNISSKFPRTAYTTGTYDGGVNNDQLVTVLFSDAVANVVTVTITGPTFGAQVIGTFTTSAANLYTPITLLANGDDSVSLVAGSNYADQATASLDDNIPVGGASQFPICTIIHERDAGGTTQVIAATDILDRRRYEGGGGSGGSGSGVGSDLEGLPFMSTFPDTFADQDRIDATETTATYDIVNQLYTLEYDTNAGAGSLSAQESSMINEEQTYSFDITPDAGNYKLVFNGSTEFTGWIAFNAIAATVQAELEALPSIGAGNITVTGDYTTSFVVTFIGALANSPQELLTYDDSFLTSGGGPVAIVLIETQLGAGPTNITWTGDPSFTVVEGDILIATIGGVLQARKITNVNSQTDVDIEAAFSANVNTATTFCVSQCVKSLDGHNTIFDSKAESMKESERSGHILLSNKGVAGADRYDHADQPDWFTPAVNDIIIQEVGSVEYETYITTVHSTTNFEVNDSTNIIDGDARIVRPMDKYLIDYSDSGLFDNVGVGAVVITDVDSAANWAVETPYVRPINYASVLDEQNITGNAGCHLYLRFFANKITGTGTVDLYDYECVYNKETQYGVSAVYMQANGLTDNGTYTNMVVSEVVGKTRITFNGTFSSFVPGVNPGESNGTLLVYLNGQKIPRYVNAIETASSYYTEGSSGLYIDLDTSYDGSTWEIDVIMLLPGVIDSSTDNNSKIGYLSDIFVGSGVGCDYATLWDAVAAVTVNQKIIVTEDQATSVQRDLSKGFPYEIEFKQGVKVVCDTALASSVIVFDDDVKTVNFRLECTHAAGTTTSGIEIDGDRQFHSNIGVTMNNAGGTITNAFILNAGVNANYLNGFSYVQAGTISNSETDNSGTATNTIDIRSY